MLAFNKFFIITLAFLLIVFNIFNVIYLERYMFFIYVNRNFNNNSQIIDVNNGGLNNNTSINSDMIKILFHCDEEKNRKLCNKAEIAFQNAATVVSNTFDFNAP